MPEFRRVLIANRGEIALRILRACRSLDLETVALCSEADRDMPYLGLADQAICIGPSPARHSYLSIERVLRAARLTGAQAIHPGYGFLSENAEFAEACEDAGITLIGPPSRVMRRMGDKISARAAMLAAGVPCLPGSDGPLPDDLKAAQALADRIGYPLIVKASGGGGGRGMRVVKDAASFAEAASAAREEARQAFGNPTIYAERFLSEPRHIEIQVLADEHGHALWLGARDCSMQRRHQKLIEEAPAPGIPADAITELGQACAHACRMVGYVGAGTFEFLYEDGAFAFIEMNTRLQVEHPVTEMTTGIDIVVEQIRIAQGHPLRPTQADIGCDGHAIECRINAENPHDFKPSPGRVQRYRAAEGPGIRVDSHLAEGVFIPPHYDGLVAKVIAHGADRTQAIARMRAALADMTIEGITTLIPLHQRLMQADGFVQGAFSVHALEDWQ